MTKNKTDKDNLQIQPEPGFTTYQDPASEEINPHFLMGRISWGLGVVAGGMNACKQQWSEMSSGQLKDFLAQIHQVCTDTAGAAELLAGHLPKDDKEAIPKMIPKNGGMTKRGPAVLRKRYSDLKVQEAKNRATQSMLSLPGRDF